MAERSSPKSLSRGTAPADPSCAVQGTSSGGCRPRPALVDRPLLVEIDAAALEHTFKVLASGTRLRLLHALLRRPGMAVTELAKAVGMKPQAISNQLQRLADKGIVSSVRDGTTIHYRVIDPCVADLIERCLCLVEDARERFARLDGAAAAGVSTRGRGRG